MTTGAPAERRIFGRQAMDRSRITTIPAFALFMRFAERLGGRASQVVGKNSDSMGSPKTSAILKANGKLGS